ARVDIHDDLVLLEDRFRVVLLDDAERGVRPHSGQRRTAISECAWQISIRVARDHLVDAKGMLKGNGERSCLGQLALEAGAKLLSVGRVIVGRYLDDRLGNRAGRAAV